MAWTARAVLVAAILALAAAPAAAVEADDGTGGPLFVDDPRPSPAPTTVIASYYGPGLWGNRTACGQLLTSELIGVAHRSLPCGSLVTLRYGESTVVVPVVDRGPFNYTREFDLTYATKAALACRDVCTLFWMR